MRVLWLMLFACFISCNIIKTYKVLQKGSVAQENYKEVIPFEMKFGLIIIKVKIEGNTYDFILDTGAPTVVSEELMGKLNLAIFSEAMASDSQGEKEKLKFVQIPKLSLQNLEFTAIGAGVVDFKKSASINAFNVYGIIGANLMRKSIWFIDFAKNQITITNKKESINNLPTTYDSIEFKPNAAGTPKIKIAYNGCVENDVIFDTGSNGEFSSTTSIYGLVKKATPKLKYAKGYGALSSGIHGGNKTDTTYFAKIDSTKIGSIELKNTAVTFENGNVKILGMGFLKNYNTLIDWNAKKISLYKTSEFSNIPLKNIGFSATCNNSNTIVSFIYCNSQAEKEGIKINDVISTFNAEPLENSIQKWYDIRTNKIKPQDNAIEYIGKSDTTGTIRKVVLNQEIILE